jgi:hypothetical protein
MCINGSPFSEFKKKSKKSLKKNHQSRREMEKHQERTHIQNQDNAQKSKKGKGTQIEIPKPRS